MRILLLILIVLFLINKNNHIIHTSIEDTSVVFNNTNLKSKIFGHPLPLPEELLESPIKLKDCPGITIIEWKPSIDKNYTKPNKTSIKILNNVCSKSVSLFNNFVIEKNLKIINNLDNLDITVSLLPWNAFDDVGKNWGVGEGYEYRNLQDIRWRFVDRFKPDDQKAEWYGTTLRKHNHIALLNDVLNIEDHPKFEKIWSHELFHALSNHTGLYKLLDRNRYEKDELLAHEFSSYIGF